VISASLPGADLDQSNSELVVYHYCSIGQAFRYNERLANDLKAFIVKTAFDVHNWLTGTLSSLLNERPTKVQRRANRPEDLERCRNKNKTLREYQPF
jgi:hypothetical protein